MLADRGECLQIAKANGQSMHDEVYQRLKFSQAHHSLHPLKVDAEKKADYLADMPHGATIMSMITAAATAPPSEQHFLEREPIFSPLVLCCEEIKAPRAMILTLHFLVRPALPWFYRRMPLAHSRCQLPSGSSPSPEQEV